MFVILSMEGKDFGFKNSTHIDDNGIKKFFSTLCAIFEGWIDGPTKPSSDHQTERTIELLSAAKNQ